MFSAATKARVVRRFASRTKFYDARTHTRETSLPNPVEIPERFREAIEALPPLLRELLDAELAQRNRIKSVTHGEPAPEGGLCIMLTNPVTSRDRASSNDLTFWLESSAEYKASFTDQNARYFILEAPLEIDGAYPDMDAIRDAANFPRGSQHRVDNTETPAARAATPQSVVDEFRAGMHINYEKWHDGIGYELAALSRATDDEKATIVSMLSPANGWRDVEALAAIDHEKARAALRTALKNGDAETRAAVLRYAPSVATDDERLDTLLSGLKHAELYGGLSSVLDEVAAFHPPAIVNALFRGLFVRPGEIATHYAAMLAFIHEKADSTFDWTHRPLFLKFNSADGAERTRAFNELCVLLELDAAAVMTSIKE